MSPFLNEHMAVLRKIAFFSTFSPEELASLAKRLARLSLPREAVLYRHGDPGDALYMVISGQLRLTQPAQNEEKIMAHVGRGDALGEMSLLTGERRTHTALVETTAEFLVLYKKDFDQLLRQKPQMGLHLSRLLSLRLVESVKSRSGESSVAHAGKIFSVLSLLDLSHRVIFTVNLALSLVEQTRRKVLLLDIVDHDSGIFASALGLAAVKVGERSLNAHDLESPHILKKLLTLHPSGLELMSLPLHLMEGKLSGALYPLLRALREKYDFTLLSGPPSPTALGKALLEESDHVLKVEDGQSSPDFSSHLEKVDPRRIFTVSLSNGLASRSLARLHQMPWSDSLNRSLNAGNVLVSGQAPGLQKSLDRLARHLAGLKVGFAMGSGAAYGYTMIGMLRVLEKNNVYPDVISGTSIGALIGSFYAAGKSPDELEEIAKGITKLKLWSLADFTLWPWQGIFLGRQVLKFLREYVGDASFEDLQLPFAAVATDINSGEEVVLKEGKVAEAVRGSLSLPFFFQPHFHQGRYLVDGGLVNPVPTSVAAAMGANILISANLTTKTSEKKVPGFRRFRRYSSSYLKGPNVFEVMTKTIYTMQYEIAQARAEIAHVLLSPDISEFTWAEFYRAPELIKIGEASMEDSLPKIKSLLPFFGDSCPLPSRAAHLRRY